MTLFVKVCLMIFISETAFVCDGRRPTFQKKFQREQSKCPKTCPKGTEQHIPPDANKPTVFDELTVTEIRSVLGYLKSEFSIIENAEATIQDKTVFIIEKMPPPKADVLALLDQNGPEVKREASVVLGTPKGMEEYIVGPLPGPTYHIPMNRSRPLTWLDRVPVLTPDEKALKTLIANKLQPIDEILRESFDGFAFNECDDKCLDYDFAAMITHEGQRLMWLYVMRLTDSSLYGPKNLFPIDMNIFVNLTSNDDSNWEIIRVWYNGQYFDSISDFREKYNANNVKKTFQPFEPEIDRHASMKRRENSFATDTKRGPSSFQPDGPRFKSVGHHVEWLNWQFDFTSRQSTGLQLFDIRFNNERIVFELSLQELGILYSGTAPFSKFHTNIVDGFAAFGGLISPLAPGVDCPSGATYFNAVTYSHYASDAIEIKNAHCIFEYVEGAPLRRHYHNNIFSGKTYDFYAGMPNNALVLRTTYAVFNYDYTIDITFYQNGVVGTKVSPSGYPIVEVSHHTENGKINSPGYDLYPFTFAPLHQHLFHFKVDLDILGSSNRHETLAIKMKSETDVLYGNKTDHFYNQYLKKESKKRESLTRTGYRYSSKRPKYYVFYNNKAENNKWGAKRAYILDNQGGSKLLRPDNWSQMKSLAWAKYQLAVTKRHDDEDKSSTPYNYVNSQDPVLNFDDFLSNDESIVDEDLVAWVTLGVQHTPNPSLDSPLTTTPGNTPAFYLKPFNFFDTDPSISSYDNVYITKDEVEQNPNNVKEACVPPEDTATFDGDYGLD